MTMMKVWMRNNEKLLYTILVLVILFIVIKYYLKHKESFSMETTNGIMSTDTKYVAGQGLVNSFSVGDKSF